jgi:glutamine amidotransferase
MGWNTVEWVRDHPLAEGIPSDSAFYFVHSFYPETPDPELVVGTTEYGVRFPSVVGRGNMVATQFHPEKSSERGLQIYRNFIRWARAGGGLPAAATAGAAP